MPKEKLFRPDLITSLDELMKLFDVIVGFQEDDQGITGHVLNEYIESQKIRIAQSRNALPLVSGAGLIYLFALWDEASREGLVIWVGLSILFAFIRTFICARIESKIDDTSVPRLYRNELALYLTAVTSTTILGTGYWFVAFGGSDRAILAIAILSCIYAVGTTANSAVHSRGMPVLLISNLGQGIVFFGAFQSPIDFEVAAALTALIYILVQFSNRISDQFSESIKIRDLNVDNNRLLTEQKEIIEHALEAANAANEDKNRFLAAASHDLRQPLHAMTLFLGSLRRQIKGKTALELVEKIDETTQVLHNQFNSLLDLSKFDAGVVEPNITKVDLDRLILKIANSIEPDAEAKNIALKVEVSPLVIESDALLLERLLTNLVINAVNFTEKGCVTITTKTSSRELVIEIQDSGQGISAEDQQKIFHDYYQVHNKARSKGKGTGLGLAIAKRITTLLDFQVTVQSELERGSTFAVHIPNHLIVDEPRIREQAPSTQTDQQIRPNKFLSGKKVLIVDDDKSIVDALSGIVVGWGASCSTGYSYDDVQQQVEDSGAFDLAILDDMLAEETTGLDIGLFLKRWMSSDQIIITTGNTNANRLSVLRNSGFTVMIKPVPDTKLRDKIETMLELT